MSSSFDYTRFPRQFFPHDEQFVKDFNAIIVQSQTEMLKLVINTFIRKIDEVDEELMKLHEKMNLIVESDRPVN